VSQAKPVRQHNTEMRVAWLFSKRQVEAEVTATACSWAPRVLTAQDRCYLLLRKIYIWVGEH
jgi:hypothetical protein